MVYRFELGNTYYSQKTCTTVQHAYGRIPK